MNDHSNGDDARERAPEGGPEGGPENGPADNDTRGGRPFTRRALLKAGAFGAAWAAAARGVLALDSAGKAKAAAGGGATGGGMSGVGASGDSAAGGTPSPHASSAMANTAVGAVDKDRYFDASAFVSHFDTGRVSRLPSGQILREYDMVAMDREIEVLPGVYFPAWTYNGQVPGPTIRCTEGDRVRVNFVNAGSHAHTIHFHGIHAANMDGVFELVAPGSSFTYEFDAKPFGLHFYHCHAVPLKHHIHKGLYGVFLVDPPGGREPANELVMVMNGFDTNFDGENEVYAANTVGFHYQRNPIRLKRGELTRVYLVNATEFDLINSLHLHGNFFRLYRTGTNLERYEYTDTVMLCQGERAVLEFTFDEPGRFMFHAHQSEFTELGWMGILEVEDEPYV